MDSIRGHQIDQRHLLNVARRVSQAEEAQRPIVQAFDEILDLIRSGARLTDPNLADVFSIASRHRVRVTEQLDRMQSIHFRLKRLNERAERQSNDDPMIGRIGTVATVSYTFDDNADIMDVGSSDASRNDERNELIVTVLAT